MLKQVQEEQKCSLNYWIEYLTSDDAIYPMWFKNYAFQGMLHLGKFDKEKGEFTKRTKSMVDGFLELNPEILAQIYTALSHEIGKDELDQEEIKALENGESFKKLYTYYLMKQGFQTNSNETDGIWIKYEQGDNYQELLKSIQGKNTGWCTAGEETCKTQLKNGDFYVYYTKDEEGGYTNPRIAIRMDGKDSIAEVRGVGEAQNLEDNMVEIADKKLDEFSDKEKYQKKVHDMKLLTEIDDKAYKGQELTKEEIIFLYEIENKINGFGYQSDPRINEIRQKRNNIMDLNDIFASYKEINNNLDLSYLRNVEGLKFPETINGYLDLRGLISAERVIFPNTIKGSLNLSRLKSAAVLTFPETIKGNLNLSGLTSAVGLTLPEVMNGDLDLSGLTSAVGLTLPEVMNGNLDLSGLTSAEDLTLPNTINGNLNLISLTSAEGLKLPETIKGSLNLSGLTSTEGLTLPNTINGNLNLISLTSVEGLKLPETINGNLLLWGLKSAKGLKLPETMNGGLNLNGLKSAEDLKLPRIINGDLLLWGLESAKDLKLPETINGDLNLWGLKSFKGLKLSKTINGSLDLGGLISAEDLTLPNTINGNLDLRSLTSAEGLKLPEIINGSLNLNSLVNAKQLMLPISTKSVHLLSLKSCKDLVVSENMIKKIYLDDKCDRADMVVLSEQDYYNYVEQKLKEMELSKVINENMSGEIMENNNSFRRSIR